MQPSQRARPLPPGENAAEWLAPAVLAALWTAVSVWRAWAAHAALLTNAYDLSSNDYALWSTAHGWIGGIPFLHSLFAYHFMPITLLILPVYLLWPAPEWVMVIQTVVLAAASLVFYAVARRMGLSRTAALLLMCVLLIARRSHSAATSFFYFESLQPLLMYLLVLAWMTERWRLFWISTILLLSTKEDMPLYLVAFAAIYGLSAPQHRRRLGLLGALAITWMAAAFLIVLPWARTLDGLPGFSPFLESRFGAIGTGFDSAILLAQRVVSTTSLRTVLSVLASAGFLSLAAPRLLLIAAPAVLVCLSLEVGNGQTALLGHYALPVLPWVFLSAAAGLARVTRWSPRAGNLVLAVLVVATVADSPLIRNLAPRPRSADAAAVLQQLHLPEGSTIAVQPNLIPHLPHSFAIRSLQPTVLAQRPDAVMIARVGNLWPFTDEELSEMILRYQADPGYEQVTAGPLYVFKKRK